MYGDFFMFSWSLSILIRIFMNIQIRFITKRQFCTERHEQVKANVKCAL